MLESSSHSLLPVLWACHIWVSISKDLENSKQAEAALAEKNMPELFQGENLYILLQEENESQ